jgi:hypothetical protein
MPPRPAAWKWQTACRSISARSPAPSASPRLTAQTSQDDPPPSLQPHYRTFIATTRRSAPVLRIGTQPSRFRPLGVSLPRTTAGQYCATGRPRARGDRFPRSAPEPGPSSRHLHAGHRLASQQASSRLIPGRHTKPTFDFIDSVSTRHQWIACARLLGPYLTHSQARLFPQRSAPRLLTDAPCGGLRPPPTGRPRRTTGPKNRPLHL